MSIAIYYFENQSLIKKAFASDAPESTSALRQIADAGSCESLFVCFRPESCTPDEKELFEWMTFFKEQDRLYSYAYYTIKDNNKETMQAPISYSLGSVRDDFNFGSLVLIRRETLVDYLKKAREAYTYAGWYSFRLYASRKKLPMLYPRNCYSVEKEDHRKSGDRQFDYTNPTNRERQIEMEKAFTMHLESLGALLRPPFKQVNPEEHSFQTEASVIIPVLNREKTIADALQSALGQKTQFAYNVIVVDNHSNDSTPNIIKSINDLRIIHLVPAETNLGIGGCWNKGINHQACGKFAIQLDSDDLYRDENTLQRIVDTFYKEHCAMVIGSYELVDFNLNPLPPGLIDHREWTPENGPNNALRINGFGAPRAFYTPVIRQIGFPNVSYGEDYAAALAVSRDYKLGRIYESVYLCRRWADNTDADLDFRKMNGHNSYKDSLRTYEILTRQKQNSEYA